MFRSAIFLRFFRALGERTIITILYGERSESMGYVAEFGAKLLNGFFKRNQFFEEGIKFQTALEKLCKKNKDKDIYVCAYKYQQNEDGLCDIKTAPIISDVYFDFDMDKMESTSYGKLKASVLALLGYLYKEMNISSSQIRLYFSGSKGFHVIIPHEIFDLQPEPDLNRKIEKFVKYCAQKSGAEHMDFGIYDKRRLFRVPGTINSKSGLYKVPVTSMQIASMSYDAMKKWASEKRDSPHEWVKAEKNNRAVNKWQEIQAYEEPKKRKGKPRANNGKKYPLLPCVQSLLKTGVASGCRNITGISIASSMLQSNLSEDEVLDLLNDWNELNDPPMDIAEVNSIYLSALRMSDSGMMYGCNSFRQLGACVETCKFYNTQEK